MELIFEVREAEEGGYVARALGQAIFTEADTWAELREIVLEVASLHFEDASAKPSIIQLHFVKDELIAFEAACSCHGVSGERLVHALEKLGYAKIRQKGSHIRLFHQTVTIHSISVPLHDPPRIGTFHGILIEVA